jgi:hypothetical protein
MTRQVSRATEMIRNAIIVALRSSSEPMGAGELVRHMPWQRRERRAYHGDNRSCDVPRDGPGDPCIVRVLACTGEIHTVDWRPTSSQLNGHLQALRRHGVVQLADGTVPGLRHLWALTAAGAARNEIDAVRGIVDLDEASAPPRRAARAPSRPAADPKRSTSAAGHVMPDARPPTPPTCNCQATIDRLTADNERLRRTVQCMISASSLISDAVGIWTMPTIPNN